MFHRNPDVTGWVYNLFNTVMTDAAYRGPLACLENVPGTVRSFCLTENPPQNTIHMLFLFSLIV